MKVSNHHVTCSKCGKKGLLLFRGDNELRIPYDWEVRIPDLGKPTEFVFLCNENGCWNLPVEDEKYTFMGVDPAMPGKDWTAVSKLPDGAKHE